MKLLHTIRLDPSDTFVFEKAAEPGEWAVSGAFVFWDTDASALQGKARSAFRSGFLGVESLGWSTLVQIVEADAADRARDQAETFIGTTNGSQHHRQIGARAGHGHGVLAYERGTQ